LVPSAFAAALNVAAIAPAMGSDCSESATWQPPPRRFLNERASSEAGTGSSPGERSSTFTTRGPPIRLRRLGRYCAYGSAPASC
jgi:hypothetical protein